MHINVDGGTAKHGENLCLTCKYAQIREDTNAKTTVFCTSFDMKVTSNTARCSMYMHMNQPYLNEMKEIAYVLTGKPGSGRMGFKHFRELDEDERAEIKKL